MRDCHFQNIIALSKLVYNIYCCVHEVPNDFAKKVNICVTCPFIWNFKPNKIQRNTLTAPIAKGGLNMINFMHVEKSLKAAWVNRFAIVLLRTGTGVLSSISNLKSSELLFVLM